MKRARCARVVLSLRDLPHAITGALLLSLSRATTVAGFRLVDTTTESLADAKVKLEDTLRLIESKQPRAVALMRRYIKRFILVKSGGPEYWPSVSAVVLTKDAFLEQSVEVSALTLIHEGVHARLRGFGVGYPDALRSRIEHMCVRAEVDFARTLPDGEALERVALEKLSREWWTDAAIAERRRRVRSQR